MSGPPREKHKLVADVCLLARDAVLLVRYRDVSKYDGQHGWFLPDDFLADGEHPLRAARRILAEQIGVREVRPMLGFVESFANGDWHLIFHTRLELASRPAVTPSDALVDARWFPLDALPPDDAMAHDGWARQVIERHRGTSTADD